jgi:hypothetical protein
LSAKFFEASKNFFGDFENLGGKGMDIKHSSMVAAADTTLDRYYSTTAAAAASNCQCRRRRRSVNVPAMGRLLSTLPSTVVVVRE